MAAAHEFVHVPLSFCLQNTSIHQTELTALATSAHAHTHLYLIMKKIIFYWTDYRKVIPSKDLFSKKEESYLVVS